MKTNLSSPPSRSGVLWRGRCLFLGVYNLGVYNQLARITQAGERTTSESNGTTPRLQVRPSYRVTVYTEPLTRPILLRTCKVFPLNLTCATTHKRSILSPISRQPPVKISRGPYTSQLAHSSNTTAKRPFDIRRTHGLDPRAMVFQIKIVTPLSLFL